LAAGTLSAAGPAKASASDQAAPTAASPQIQSLFTLPDLDFDTLFAFGGTGYGSAEFGELAAAVNAINAAGVLPGLLRHLQRPSPGHRHTAGQDLAAGHTASARSGYLRAASYYELTLRRISDTVTARVDSMPEQGGTATAGPVVRPEQSTPGH
jgi:hypothetical protein